MSKTEISGKTIRYKVTPTNGKYKAPPISVEARDAKEAITEAKKRSGLSRFPDQWVFIPQPA